MTQTEMIEAVKRGERIKPEYSMFDAPLPTCTGHDWRTIACNNDQDVDECRNCGVQRVTTCNFDDEFS